MTIPNNRSTVDNPDGLYRHVEFDDHGYINWVLSEDDGGYIALDIKSLALTKKEAAKLAGHLLQASDADDLAAVGDDK